MRPKPMRSSAPSLADRLEDPGLLITGNQILDASLGKKSISAGSQPGTRLSPSYCVRYFGDTRRIQMSTSIAKDSMFTRKRETNVPLSRHHFRGDDTHPRRSIWVVGGWADTQKSDQPPSPTIMMLIGDGNCNHQSYGVTGEKYVTLGNMEHSLVGKETFCRYLFGTLAVPEVTVSRGDTQPLPR